MQHTPKTDAELARENLIAPGVYEAEVLECEEKQSKSGKDMLKLKLNIEGRHVYDYISPEFMHHKYKHFFESAGKLAVYEKGEYDASDCVRWFVTAIVDQQEQAGYPPKNIVKDYTKPESVIDVGRSGPAPVQDDDLPF